MFARRLNIKLQCVWFVTVYRSHKLIGEFNRHVHRLKPVTFHLRVKQLFDIRMGTINGYHRCSASTVLTDNVTSFIEQVKERHGTSRTLSCVVYFSITWTENGDVRTNSATLTKDTSHVFVRFVDCFDGIIFDRNYVAVTTCRIDFLLASCKVHSSSAEKESTTS